MSRGEVRAAANRAGFLVSPFRRGPDGPEGMQVAGQLFIYFDSTDRVEAVEIATTGEIPVVWQGLDLSGPAREVVAAFDMIATPDSADPEFPATTCYPAIGLCLWKEAKPGRPLTGAFEAALVRRPDHTAAR
jgi:hypothetical protein